jgi:SAM-dependent methyltransferase
MDQLIERFYPDAYHCYQYADCAPGSLRGLSRIFDNRTNGPRRKRLKRHFKGRKIRLLDVGCGDGGLLKHLAWRTDWDLKGVEPNPAVAEAVRRSGIDVDCGLLHDMHYPAEHFHAVTLTHVIEHVSDPPGLLKEIHRILKPGGMLIVEVPNLRAIERTLLGPYWWGYHLPRHLFHFTQHTLEMLCTSAGFRRAGLRYVFTMGSMAWNISILMSHAAGGRLRKVAPSNTNPLLLAAVAPLECLNILLRRGNLMEMAFEKPAIQGAANDA